MVSLAEEFDYRYADTVVAYNTGKGVVPFSIAGIAKMPSEKETDHAFNEGTVKVVGNLLYSSEDRWKNGSAALHRLDVKLPTLGVFNVGETILALSYIPGRVHKRGFRMKNTIHLSIGGNRTQKYLRSTELYKEIFNPHYPEISTIFEKLNQGEVSAQAFNSRMWIGRPLLKNGTYPVFGYDYMMVGYIQDQSIVHLLPQYQNLIEEVSEWFPVVIEEKDVFSDWIQEAIDNHKDDPTHQMYSSLFLTALRHAKIVDLTDFFAENDIPVTSMAAWVDDPDHMAMRGPPTALEWGMLDYLGERRPTRELREAEFEFPVYAVIAAMLNPEFFDGFRPQFYLTEDGPGVAVSPNTLRTFEEWRRHREYSFLDLRPALGAGLEEDEEEDDFEEVVTEGPEIPRMARRNRTLWVQDVFEVRDEDDDDEEDEEDG